MKQQQKQEPQQHPQQQKPAHNPGHGHPGNPGQKQPQPGHKQKQK